MVLSITQRLLVSRISFGRFFLYVSPVLSSNLDSNPGPLLHAVSRLSSFTGTSMAEHGNEQRWPMWYLSLTSYKEPSVPINKTNTRLKVILLPSYVEQSWLGFGLSQKLFALHWAKRVWKQKIKKKKVPQPSMAVTVKSESVKCFRSTYTNGVPNVHFQVPITLSFLDLRLKGQRPSCQATPCQVNTFSSLFTPMMPFICCPSWVNGVLGQKGRDCRGSEHLPVLQWHNKLLTNAGLWQNVFITQFVCVCVCCDWGQLRSVRLMSSERCFDQSPHTALSFTRSFSFFLSPSESPPVFMCICNVNIENLRKKI